MGKLQINDSAFQYQGAKALSASASVPLRLPRLLHMEIIRSGSGGSTTWTSSPPTSVIYEVQKTNGELVEVDNPAHLPEPSVIAEIVSRSLRLHHGAE